MKQQKKKYMTNFWRVDFIHSEMNGEYHTNGLYDIFDASPNNVLVGIDGCLYFIDTIIYQSDEDNFSIYKSQSPKYFNR